VRLPIVFVVLGVLAPTGAVLWFMSEAARSQTTSARQSVTEAYRGQMRLLRDGVDGMWRARADAMESAVDLPTALQSSGADSAILLDAQGAAIQRARAGGLAADPLANRAEWIADAGWRR
jgi:hypothetical protein